MILVNSFINWLVALKMAMVKQFLWKSLIQKTHHPMDVQRSLLQKIIQTNKDTVFGKQHHFGNIKYYKGFRQEIDVQSYEDLTPYIDKQEYTKKLFLNATQPVLYTKTSGSSGKPKYIPILQRTIEDFMIAQHISAYVAYRDIPGIYDGKILAIAGPDDEGRLETGTPCGSMTAVVYQSMPGLMQRKYIVPPAIFRMDDYDLKYYLITLFALEQKHTTLMVSANPSTFLKIYDIIQDHWNDLIRDIQLGHSCGLKKNPKRASELTNMSPKRINFVDLWPELKAVATWTGGSCSVLIPRLRGLVGHQVKIVDQGYVASEFRGSLPVDIHKKQYIPTIHENFFEFVERDHWGANTVGFLTLDGLEVGKKYYIFVTTQHGLYRYFINDIIEVDGYFNNTPTIRFVQKGVGVTNLTGEKLYAFQVFLAIESLRQEENLAIDFFFMLGCPTSLRYDLYLESELLACSSEKIESYLMKLNIEFEEKRKSDRLKQTAVYFLNPGTGDCYKKHCIKQGQREAQLKCIHLQYKQDCSFHFNQHVRR